MQLFEQKPIKKEEEKVRIDVSQTQDILSLIRRIRELEERLDNLRAKDQIIERNILDHFKKFKEDISTINSDIMEIKNELNRMSADSGKIIRELKLTASREDMKVLQRYVDLWNPMKFVTREEVKRLVFEALNDNKEEPQAKGLNIAKRTNN